MAVDGKYLHSDISDKILKAFFTVRSSLPYGLDLEIYRRALFIEMTSIGLIVDKDKVVSVMYKDHPVGSVTLDFVVNDKIIIKLVYKLEAIDQKDKDDMRIHLQLTKCEVGLILNFHPEEGHKRVVYTSDQKTKDNN